VRLQGKVEAAEDGYAEREAALLQGNQRAAADAAQAGGDVGEDAAEQPGEQHRLPGAD
jgi:hypothetical protein